MTRVNPPPQLPIPKEASGKMKEFLSRQQMILFQLWKRTGGSEDLVADTAESEIFDQDIARSSDFLSLPVTVTAVDHTSTESEIISCTNTSEITITLNDIPDDGEKVRVKRTASKVVVSGNGNTIDGDTTVIITAKHAAPTFIYTVDVGEWGLY